MINHLSLVKAVLYLKYRGVSIPQELKDILPSRAIKQAISYQPIRQEMWAAVYDTVYDFLSGNGQAGNYANTLATAVSKAYIDTGDIAYEDGGGTLPLDEDTLAYATGELNAQLGYVDSLFQTLKSLRKEGDFDAIDEAFKRADGYSNSLDMFYNSIKTMAAGNKMLTFTGTDGRESCDDCKRYKNQRHRASWWVSHNAVPPSRDFACGGYHCDHVLVDDDGQEFTI
jgi:hypothetical protein